MFEKQSFDLEQYRNCIIGMVRNTSGEVIELKMNYYIAGDRLQVNLCKQPFAAVYGVSVYLLERWSKKMRAAGSTRVTLYLEGW